MTTNLWSIWHRRLISDWIFVAVLNNTDSTKLAIELTTGMIFSQIFVTTIQTISLVTEDDLFQLQLMDYGILYIWYWI